MKTAKLKTNTTQKLELIARFVDVTLHEDGQRYKVGSGGKYSGQRGQVIATLGLRHSPGYEVVLQLDSGQTASFAPFSLFPEQAGAATSGKTPTVEKSNLNAQHAPRP